MSDWISIEEQLPKPLQRVIVFDRDGFGALSGRMSRTGLWYLEGDIDTSADITHWMPLPDPPNTLT